jgi:molybdate transport system substrate-binding protein
MLRKFKITMFLVLVFSCITVNAETMRVAVAANMQYVFHDLAKEFQKQTGNDVQGVFNSSGKLVNQITNGAPFDMFLSADMEYPMALYEKKLAIEAPKIYAYGAIVLWTMKETDLRNWQTLLKKEGLGKVAIANPKTAPYGRETMRILQFYKLDQVLNSKLVFGESISQTNQYIFSGAVDFGFTAKSVVLAKEMQGKGTWIEMPESSYSKIAQGAVILEHGKKHFPKIVKQFDQFLSSQSAQAIFLSYGYTLP